MIDRRDHAFPPAVREDCRVLILGSLPGRRSLAQSEYYAHPGNQFWRLMSEVIEFDLAQASYTRRLAQLAKRGVGLWDTIASAIRPGSLDAAIRSAEVRPLAAFARRLPNLRAIGFNGATSARLGRPQLSGSRCELIDLPSSSAAHAAMPFAAKLERWMSLRPFLA